MQALRGWLRSLGWVGDVVWWRAAHIEIGMLVKFDTTSGLSHGIAEVGIGRDCFRFDLTSFTPFQQGKISNIDMACALRRSSSIHHEYCASVVDQQLRRVVLGEAEVCQDGADV